MTEMSVERRELREAVRRCLERGEGPRPYLVGEPGTSEPYDGKLWHLLGAEVGVAGLIVPEEHGGAGARLADLAVVAEELGRFLAPVPFLSTVALATPALLLSDGDALAGELLARIAGGNATATLACCDGDGSWDVETAAVSAVPAGGGWRLSGSASFAVDAVGTDILLVPARTGAGLGLFAVERDAPGLRCQASTTLDLTRPLGTVTLEAAPGRPIGPDSGAEAVLRPALDVALALLAAEQVGGAQRCLDEAVAYAKQRIQFDRPIGSFQAIKHTLVDMLLKVEMARSAASIAVAAADEYLAAPGEENARRLAAAASLAKSVCSEAFMYAAEESLHVHGGIGFTWEHDCHLYYRRAKASELFLGDPGWHRERLAVCAGL
ncbi:acyl-CoA dehydrogenase [Actinomadura sp. NBRC 104425]|uniref:acyl-CoA dehydrogenase family protein n=1 Tax=Actinomadura sp. NBRC 104425 TaxID=3032204 RepID=UPI0024A150D4|nr:acyl-CoA dehydrogenase family protein [Actinomadura sp. NBRC 104425]GLZ15963.1 acyl-CoA dehydrogenase [Actinomadura sp. NBRC 104425]